MGLFFCALYFVVLMVTVIVISHHKRLARWSTPFMQPAYRLNLMCTFRFFHGK